MSPQQPVNGFVHPLSTPVVLHRGFKNDARSEGYGYALPLQLGHPGLELRFIAFVGGQQLVGFVADACPQAEERGVGAAFCDLESGKDVPSRKGKTKPFRKQRFD